SEQIHVIHAHEFYMNVIGCAVSCLTGVPLIATVHGKNYYPEKTRRCAAYRFIANRAAVLVAVSQNLREFFCHSTRVEPSLVKLLYNGIDIRPLANVTRDSALLDALGIAPGSSVVGTVGNLYPVKGQIHLIRAAPAIIQHHPSTHIMILGRGGLQEALMKEAQ